MNALTSSACIVLCGCALAAEKDSAGKLSPHIVKGEAPKTEALRPEYRFHFTKPVEQERSTQPGKKVSIAFTLHVPQGTPPPTFVVLHLMSGKTIVDSRLAEPSSDPTNGDYVFESSMKSPQVPGAYSIRVEAIQTTIYTGHTRDAVIRDVRVHSPLLKLAVKKEPKIT